MGTTKKVPAKKSPLWEKAKRALQERLRKVEKKHVELATEDKKIREDFQISSDAWKIQAEAITAVEKRVTDTEADIKTVAEFVERKNTQRVDRDRSLNGTLWRIEKQVIKLKWIVRNTLFWMTMLGLTMAALNMALLHLLVNR
jgi:hypothetical protein